jgi:hypothetical protein
MCASHDPVKALAKYFGMIIGPVQLGMLDYIRFPDRRDPWGGAFNGQSKRRELFSWLIDACRPAAIVETGTYRGVSTEFMAKCSNVPIYSVESDARNFGFAKMRLWKHRTIHLSVGDSRKFLMEFITANTHEYIDRALLFYLDAHWGDDLPLSDELEIIFSSCLHPIVMIDDFEVPGDNGYGYDDYGFGRALTRSYIASQVKRHELAEFYPITPSGIETGRRRGCVVLLRDPELIAAVSKSLLLKRWEA